MLKTVKDACELHPMALSYTAKDQIENILDLINQEGDGTAFFQKNFVTSGMANLFQIGMKRLAGLSDQAVCHLVQAMGGGQTHMMIALGLLARDRTLRQQVIPALDSAAPFADARVVAFNGRNNPQHFIWGEIATQLGKAEEFFSYWQNGAIAPDQNAWKNLIGEEPTLILLDELPPYLDNAFTRPVGEGNLSQVTTYALSTLLSAALELPRCFIVISDLSGTYENASRNLRQAIKNFEQETNRQSRRITPVDLAGDEIYQILKKRLFSSLPPESEIDRIAEAYAQSIAEAEKAKVITKTIEQIAEEVRNSYPFHPSVKDVIALFRNNEGFRQTRGLMQFISKIIRSVWNRHANDVYLMGVQHLNLNDTEVGEEIIRICDLRNAIAHDIASAGSAHAEVIDERMNSDAGSQVAALIMSASLSTAVDAVKGMTKQQLLEYLITPDRTALEFDQAFEYLRKGAWYLHRNANDAFYFSNIENLTKRLEKEAERAPDPKVQKEMRRLLVQIFRAEERDAYQDCEALPVVSEIVSKVKGPGRTLLILTPDTQQPPAEAKQLYESVVEKNNVLIVTGNVRDLSELERYTRRLYAIAKVKEELSEEHPHYKDLEGQEKEAVKDFFTTVVNTFNRIYYPTRQGLMGMALPMTFEENRFCAEEQIKKNLASNAVLKLYLDVEASANELLDRAEAQLWLTNQRRIPWRDVVSNSLTNPRWVWLPYKGLETLRKIAEQQDRWRSTDDGYIEKGPFEQPKTEVTYIEREYDEATGTATLDIKAVYPKEGGLIRYAETPEVTEQSPLLENSTLQTSATRLYFRAFDPKGKHEVGEAKVWMNQLTIAHQPSPPLNGKRTVALQVRPRGIIRYTLTGANPKDGTEYSEPITIGEDAVTLYVYAEDQGVVAHKTFMIPPVTTGQGLYVQPDRPALLRRKIPTTATADTFKFINRAKERQVTLRGMSIEVGQGAKSITSRLGSETEITAETLEQLITVMRLAIGDDMAEVKINAQSVQFQMGADLESFLRELGLEVTQTEVEQ